MRHEDSHVTMPIINEAVMTLGYLNLFSSAVLAGVAAALPIFVWSCFGDRYRRKRQVGISLLCTSAIVVVVVIWDHFEFFKDWWPDVLKYGPSYQSWPTLVIGVLIISTTVFALLFFFKMKGEWGVNRSLMLHTTNSILVGLFIFATIMSSEETITASGFTVRRFESINIGDSTNEVYRVLGPPLWQRTDNSGNDYLIYSGGLRNGWEAWVYIKDSKVTRTKRFFD